MTLKATVGTCELCGRQEVKRTIHHLVPKEEGGVLESTSFLCIPCHKQIHALYTNQEIALRLTTVESLQQDPKLQSFIKWIRKQHSSTIPKTTKSNAKRQKGK